MDISDSANTEDSYPLTDSYSYPLADSSDSLIWSSASFCDKEEYGLGDKWMKDEERINGSLSDHGGGDMISDNKQRESTLDKITLSAISTDSNDGIFSRSNLSQCSPEVVEAERELDDKKLRAAPSSSLSEGDECDLGFGAALFEELGVFSSSDDEDPDEIACESEGTVRPDQTTVHCVVDTAGNIPAHSQSVRLPSRRSTVMLHSGEHVQMKKMKLLLPKLSISSDAMGNSNSEMVTTTEKEIQTDYVIGFVDSNDEDFGYMYVDTDTNEEGDSDYVRTLSSTAGKQALIKGEEEQHLYDVGSVSLRVSVSWVRVVGC